MKCSNADKWFSKFVRLRDADSNGCAQCCTCGKYIDVKFADCGHWIKRQHQATRFSEMNCHTQCKKCNAFEQGRDADYERFLIEKYGRDKVDILKFEGTRTVKRTKLDLDYLAVYFKQKATELSRSKGIPLW
jgi:hypothetical protein